MTRTPIRLPYDLTPTRPLRTPIRLEDPPPPKRTPIHVEEPPPQTPEDLFWTFVSERHEVFIRRVVEHRPPPWTDDPALAAWHYTNVYRELDRVTLDLIANVLCRHASWPPIMRTFEVIAYRVFNEPGTYAALRGLGFHSPNEIEQMLLQRQADGLTVFRPAYRVQSSREPGEGARTRTWVRRLAQIRQDLGGIWWRRLEQAAAAQDRSWGMRQAHTWLTTLPGIGPFLAYEILIDLCYDPPVLPFSENDWVNVGPGAADGLRALRLEPTEQSIRALAARQRDGLARVGRVLRGPDLTLRNVEHCCCEFSKYVRARAGGHNKRRYTARTESSDFTPWEDLDPRYWKAP